jgi:hypothetical protein
MRALYWLIAFALLIAANPAQAQDKVIKTTKFMSWSKSYKETCHWHKDWSGDSLHPDRMRVEVTGTKQIILGSRIYRSRNVFLDSFMSFSGLQGMSSVLHACGINSRSKVAKNWFLQRPGANQTLLKLLNDKAKNIEAVAHNSRKALNKRISACRAWRQVDPNDLQRLKDAQKSCDQALETELGRPWLEDLASGVKQLGYRELKPLKATIFRAETIAASNSCMWPEDASDLTQAERSINDCRLIMKGWSSKAYQGHDLQIVGEATAAAQLEKLNSDVQSRFFKALKRSDLPMALRLVNILVEDLKQSGSVPADRPTDCKAVKPAWKEFIKDKVVGITKTEAALFTKYTQYIGRDDVCGPDSVLKYDQLIKQGIETRQALVKYQKDVENRKKCGAAAGIYSCSQYVPGIRIQEPPWLEVLMPNCEWKIVSARNSSGQDPYQSGDHPDYHKGTFIYDANNGLVTIKPKRPWPNALGPRVYQIGTNRMTGRKVLKDDGRHSAGATTCYVQ